MLTRKFRNDPVFFIPGEKLGLCRTTGEQEVGEHPTDHRRDALQNEQPPPTAHTQPLHMVQNEPGNRTTQDALVTGIPTKTSAMACACSRWRNQYVRYKTTPG